MMDEIKIKKRNAELAILEIISEFNRDTGLTINSIDIEPPFSENYIIGSGVQWAVGIVTLNAILAN